MSVKQSVSLVLVWRIAELEARQLKSDMIEPVHLLLALAKCVDVDLTNIVSKEAEDHDEILEQLLREVRRVRTVFRRANVDAKLLRRQLRKAAPVLRFAIAKPGVLHRSTAAKKIFAEAKRFAAISDQTVYPIHLLLSGLIAHDQLSSEVMRDIGIDQKAFQETANSAVFALKRRGVSFEGDSKLGHN